MDSFELNKIIAAILMVALLIIGIGKLSNIIFYVEKPKKPGYSVDVEQTVVTSAKSTSETVEEKVDMASLMALGDLTTGEKVFKKCAACHSINEGGKNKIGPALWSVMSRKSGELQDYKYSKALLSYEKKWDFLELNGFLLKPATWIKGNKMGFAGLKDDKDRASVILYLNESANSPLPLP